MTDATGRSFLSYRRSRAGEARLLIEAQHDLGIPTWQDLSELEEGHTATLLEEALAAENTANAVCWLTPDVETSAVITRTELPGIMRRIDSKDGFFMVPVAAGGMDYEDVTRFVGTYLGLHDLGQWNVRKVTSDPVSEEEAAGIARRVLHRRMRAVMNQLTPDAPLRIGLNTRKKPAFEPGMALSVDWTHRFDGRIVNAPGLWEQRLLPSLEIIAQAIEQYAPGRRLVAEGLCALPAAIALGTVFLATRGLPLAWRQISPNRPPQLWSLNARPEPSGFEAQIVENNPAGEDLVLLVSVTSNVEAAFAATRPQLHQIRGFVTVAKPGTYPHDLETPGQARDVVEVVVKGLRRARDVLQPRGTLHVFLAVPAGLAMMIGQMLNTFGPVQTYEHVATDSVGVYQPAARLDPSG
jgi:SMODS-associated and fused to various effectors sensor domain